MKLRLLLLPLILTVVLACRAKENVSPTGTEIAAGTTAEIGFYLPKGDPESGRKACLALGCTSCHAVDSPGFPATVASPPVPVTLGVAQAKQSRAQLAESIIAPSHKVPGNIENVSSGKLSRMGDYSHCMTVRELVDLIAFIQSLDHEQDAARASMF